MSDLDALLLTAIEATDRASTSIRNGAAGTLTPKGDRDYASEVDVAVERQLRTFLSNATPQISFLGEEEGQSGSSGGGRQWTLDPIDGTVNFAHAIPLCGVSLALVADNRPILGVIQLPFLGDRYTAIHTRGAFRNGRPIHVSAVDQLHDAVVSLGDFAVGTNAHTRNAPRLAVTAELARAALRVRMLGSAAVDLVWLAEGKTDAVIIFSNKPWDTAAGVIIAREAGATVADLDGADHTTESQMTIAAPPDLVAELLHLVRNASAGT